VQGNERLSTGEIEALIGDVRGQSLLLVDLQQFQARLLASPWVQSVTVRRVLPSTVDLRIVERDPVAIARLGQMLYLVDGTGVIMDDYGPQHADYDLPIVDGMAAAASETGRPIDPARAHLTARFLASLAGRPELRKAVSQVDVSRENNVVVLLGDDPALLYLGDEQFVERLRTYLEIRPTLAERMADVDYVDLRFGQRVIAKERKDRAHR
jgi:cell division protein FtsQ